MRTVVDAILRHATGSGSLTVAGASATDDTTVAWAALHERAQRVARVLAENGIGRGARVGVLGDISVSLVTAVQAVWLRGAAFTVLPLPHRTPRPVHLSHLRAIVADARLDLVLVDETSAEAFGVGLSSATRVITLSTLERDAAAVSAAAPIRPDPADLAILQYTSGSTRRPHGVAVTHANLAANLDAIESQLGRDVFTADSCVMSWLPLYHDMGLIGFLAMPMSRGCPLVLQSPRAFALRPASWLERLSRHRAVCTGAPNFAYELLVHLLEAGMTADLSSVRVMLSGGEPIDAAMMARFAAAAGRNGLDPAALIAAYGLAEATLAVSFSSGTGITTDTVDRDMLERDGRAVPAAERESGRQLVRLGKPVSGTHIRIVNRHTGAPVGPRTVGHIEVSGESVTRGYWGDLPRPPGSWLRTGDLGYLADGDLVVCGREKDVLFAAGRNVYPQDVEAAVARVPGIRSGGAAAFGIPANHGDRLVVAIESRSRTDDDNNALRKAIAVAVAHETGMVPMDVVTLPLGRLPKTSSGKLRRAETRRRYLAGELAATSLPLVDRSVQ